MSIYVERTENLHGSDVTVQRDAILRRQVFKAIESFYFQKTSANIPNLSNLTCALHVDLADYKLMCQLISTLVMLECTRSSVTLTMEQKRSK